MSETELTIAVVPAVIAFIALFTRHAEIVIVLMIAVAFMGSAKYLPLDLGLIVIPIGLALFILSFFRADKGESKSGHSRLNKKDRMIDDILNGRRKPVGNIDNDLINENRQPSKKPLKKQIEEKWTKHGFNKITGTKYDPDGYMQNGFNANGFNRAGIFELTKNQYDINGYDCEGFDKLGWGESQYNKFTGTKYDKFGFDKEGFTELGYDSDGYNKEGFNKNNMPRYFYIFNMSKEDFFTFLDDKYKLANYEDFTYGFRLPFYSFVLNELKPIDSPSVEYLQKSIYHYSDRDILLDHGKHIRTYSHEKTLGILCIEAKNKTF